MSSNPFRAIRPSRRLAVLFALSAGFGGRFTPAQLSPEATAQIREQAALFATQPAKVSAALVAPAVSGAATKVQVSLLTSSNRPAQARQDWKCDISIVPPSGIPLHETVTIPRGQTSAQFEFLPQEAGLTSIAVQPEGGALRPTKTEFIVTGPHKGVAKRPLASPHGSIRFPDWNATPRPAVDATAQLPKFETVALTLSPTLPQPAEPQTPPQPTTASPMLHISLDQPGGLFFADGQSGPEITVLYDSPDGSPAPTDINVWFDRTDGSLDPPQPIKIAKGTTQAQTRLVSLWPKNIQVRFFKSSPSYQAEGDIPFTADFGPAGVALVGPSSVSVLEAPQVMVVTSDAQGNPISPEKDLNVMLESTNSKFHLAPASFAIKPPMPVGSAVLSPVSFGSDSIQAVVAAYPTKPLSIVVTWWQALVVCIVGGTLGGLAGFIKFKRSWASHIFLGVLGGTLLCWMYVFLAAPSFSSNIAHNTVSAFFVALIGGFGGLAVFDLLANKFGLSSPKAG